MAAPHIPNLNSLRRGNGRGRGRGRSEQSIVNDVQARDKIIQQTDGDAANSRLSAVEAGYLDDPFVHFFRQDSNEDGSRAVRRLPLMNRGTYIRTAAIDRLIEAFLGFDANRPRQIISLGAGSDTRFFRFRKRYAQIDLAYHEFDFPLNTKQKIRQMQTVDFYQAISKEWGVDWTPEGRVVYEDDAKEPPCFHLETGKSNYYLHSLDLRSLVARDQTPGAVEGNLSRWKISIAIPTVILSECCLIYLSPEEADATLSYFSKPFRENYAPIGVVIYEPIRPNDAFGKTMVSNLTARGIHLQTLHAHDTLKSQQERLWKQGLKSDANQQGEEGAEGEAAAKDRVSVVDGGAEAADIDFLWRTWIDDREKQRIEKLEWMDELEEFTLLARHYCAVWAWKESSGRPHQHFHNDAGSGELGRIFANWARLPTQEPKE